jgi:hypothetical protein
MIPPRDPFGPDHPPPSRHRPDARRSNRHLGPAALPCPLTLPPPGRLEAAALKFRCLVRQPHMPTPAPQIRIIERVKVAHEVRVVVMPARLQRRGVPGAMLQDCRFALQIGSVVAVLDLSKTDRVQATR